MARKREAEKLLKQGLLPSEIAERMQISPSTIVQYLRTRVGEGALRFSEIFFSWPVKKREVLEEAAQRVKSHRSAPAGLGVVPEDLEFYRSIRQRWVFAGDLYGYLAETEIAVHDLVRSVLVAEFGDGDAGYWRQGIPLNIRKSCQARREEDEAPSDSPFHYTTLVELSEIVAKRWPLFQKVLPDRYGSNRQAVGSDFLRLNGIRNTVMHPVKRRRWTDDDFEFAKRMHAAFEGTRVK
jgi:hypothetical protein